MPMKYKLTENGNVVVDEKTKLPIMIKEDGEEISIDAIHLYNSATDHAEESKKRKGRIKELSDVIETIPKSVLEDPAAAAQAMIDIVNLKDVDLKNKGELDRLKTEMEDAWKGKLEIQKGEFDKALFGKDQEIGKAKKGLFDSMVATQFHQSPLFAGEDRTTTMSSNVAVKVFGENFKVEETDDGRNVVVGYIDGKPVYSTERPGEIATFSEAIPRVVEASGEKIMKDSTGSGSGGGKSVFSGRTVEPGSQGFIDNLDDIASGKIKVNTAQ